ncbi:MAG TPA: VWA domain-containing protein, partial [Blastocatellia bacterium]|nr:VWA domain-containing protein [Blastocatellia bacterium]
QTANDSDQNPVKLKTQLVEVNAVVTDRRGHPITGLTKEDFEVRENGRTQEVSFFSAVAAARPPAGDHRPSPARPGEVAEPGTAAQRTVVIFVDSFNMSAESLLRAKQALRRFVDEKLSDQDMVAIVASSGSLGLLGQFTRDRAILHYAIERIGSWRVGTSSLFSPYLAAQVEAGDGMALGVATPIVVQEDHLEGMPAQMLQSYVHSRARMILSEAGYGRRVTLLTLKAVIDRLATMPGQRIVAMLSDGFTLRDDSGRMESSELDQVTSSAARSGVVIYSIFAPGLVGLPMFDASQTGLSSVSAAGPFFTYTRAGEDDDKNVLNALAKDTGGDAFFDNNDLLGSLQKGLDANRVYYTLAYYPNDTKDEKKFRKIQVKVVAHPEYLVRAQKGYLPVVAVKHAKSELSATPAQRLLEAMGEPLAVTTIGVESSADYYEREGDESQVYLHTYIAGNGIDYRRENDRYQFKLEIVIDVLDQTGRQAFFKSETISGNLTPEHMETAKARGFTLTKGLSLKPGLYQIRIGVQEDTTGKIGTASCWVEVPDLKRHNPAMSSVMIGLGQPAGKIAEVQSGSESATIHAIKFFRARDKIVYAFNIYNSPVDGSGASRLEMQLEFIRGSETLAKSDWNAVASRQMGKDKLGILVGGEVPIGNLSPGVYELRVALRDPESKRKLGGAAEFGID